MNKLILSLIFVLIARLGFAQATYFTFDSIANPPYICQAHVFNVEVFGYVSSNMVQATTQSYYVSQDSIYIQFHFAPGAGGTGTPRPMSRSITIPAPGIGPYKIIAQGFYNGQLHRTLTSAISICSSIAGISKTDKTEPQLTVFPNPVQDLLQVAVPVNKAGLKLTLTNVIGTTLQTKVMPAGSLQTRLNLKALPAGVYLLQVASEEKKFTQKIIKH